MKNLSKISYRTFLIVGFCGVFFLGLSKKKEFNFTGFFESDEQENLEREIEIDSPDVTLRYPYVGTNNPSDPKTSLVGLKEPLNIKRTITTIRKMSFYERFRV